MSVGIESIEPEAPVLPVILDWLLGDYCPISIASTILHAFHKILAWRLHDTLQFSPFQHGFLQQDGCLKVMTLLHTILQRVHMKHEPCAMLFLDIAKVFDTVSHHTLFRVALAAGLPPPLVLEVLRLQEKLHLLSKALTQARMALNAKKSLGLTITRDGKRKCMGLLPTIYECEGGSIKSLGPRDSVRYLGLQFNWKGRMIPKNTGKLDSLLQELSQAPLKPQQWMLLL
ncbi:hypothetical protein L345_13152, partial [Ophiophagus hannah]